MRVTLPIDPILTTLVESLERTPNLVLKAAPGSGKTTRVPPALLDTQFAARREILVLEPRRLAAKYSARRVADELGETVGKTVGYQFRFENVGGPATRLRFITEGMLLRRLQSDPSLKNVAAVLLDEFHERHLMTDAALAVLKNLQSSSRPELRIIVMSATLDTQQISEFLDAAPVFEVENRPYPVTLHHLPSPPPPQKPLENLVREAVVRAFEDGEPPEQNDESKAGDILVFLPGMAEIRRAEQALELAFAGQHRSAPLILTLHGELSRDEQDRALARADRRKVILSTNVAETSLTIEGVTVVVDSGLHRQAAYSAWSGLPALRTRTISRASATQRAGRAGRTAPGRCYRLYTQGDFNARPPFEIPEIQRADLSPTLLELKSLGIRDLSPGAKDFRWFEPPAPTAIDGALQLLHLLGALDAPRGTATLTPVGEALAHFPVHPRIARLLLEAERLNVLEDAAQLAALLSEGRLERLDAIDNLGIPIQGEALRRSRTQLIAAARAAPAPTRTRREAPGLKDRDDRLRFALLTGFPDRVARVRQAPASASRGRDQEVELVFCRGGSAQIADTHAWGGNLLLALDVQEESRSHRPGGTRIKVRGISTVQEDWLIDLEPSLLSENDHFTWDEARKRVMRSARLAYGELALSESSAPAEPAGEATGRVLTRGALGADWDRLASGEAEIWIEALARLTEREPLENAFARAALLAHHFPDASTGATDAAVSLRTIFEQCVSTRELSERDWAYEILAARAPELTARAEQLLPLTIALPSGRRAKIHYAEGKPPWVESRLQDFFGMKRAPALLDGKLPLTVHLLAPNQRALQVTSDLAGFWEREYPELRRALSRRYPRHSWPENPLTHEAKPGK